jgi:hypothetical protein
MERRMTEKISYDHNEDKVVVQREYDVQPLLERQKMLQNAGAENFGESKYVGSVPTHLVEQWCKEAGLQPHDTEARKEVLRKKLLSGDFDKLRVWKGRF